MTRTNAPGAADASKEQAIALVDASFLAELRAKMHKFARLQLNDDDLAEDVVQEALMGALRNAKSFAGRGQGLHPCLTRFAPPLQETLPLGRLEALPHGPQPRSGASLCAAGG